MTNSAGDKAHRENLERLAEHRDRSAIFDSRVRYWCDRFGVDPEPRYEALYAGKVVTFQVRRRGVVVSLHRIDPDIMDY